MEIRFFNKHIKDFIQSLERMTYLHVVHKIGLLEEFGVDVGFPHSKKILKKLFELRVRGVHEVRLIYTFHQGIVVILHAFIKKTNKIPLKEIKLAKKRLNSLI